VPGKPPSRQKGYALPEVLVATVIAAGVLTAVAGGVSSVVRLSSATEDRAQTLHEGKQIAARLRAGMSEKDALEGLYGWRLDYAPYEDAATARQPAPFDIVNIRREGRGGFEFAVLVPQRANTP
jgi:prepilin-type N-terminal cleavage/methylation domain-containing protein